MNTVYRQALPGTDLDYFDARAAVDAIIREVGPNSKDADSMRLLAENPREHWTWGKRRKKPRDKQ